MHFPRTYDRLTFRIRPEGKALLLRAATLERTNLTEFVLGNALRAAKAVVEEATHLQLSEQDSLRVLELLQSPPAPNARLMEAARAMPPEG